jgi:hypothetical protein
MKSVDVIDVLLALINLALDPVPIQILEKVMDVFRSDGIPIPFFDIEGQ